MAAPATSIQIAVAQPVPSVEISTPRWLVGSVVLVWLLAIAFVVTSIVAVREHRDALKTIANDAARSVIAAERIAAALADMDANASNGLLSTQFKDTAAAAYDKSREEMTNALIDAAQNISFDGEREEIKGLAKNSGIYGERVESAFTLQNTNPAAALAKYKSAATLLDTTLMPSARKVDKINRDALDAGYQSIGRSSTIQMALVWLTGLGMLAVLLRIQFFLSEKMRRTLNPLGAVSTVLTLALLLYTTHALSTASHQVDVVKKDAFESVHSLWQAKAVAYEANAQESRYLLDKAGAAGYQKYFQDMTTAMSNDPEQLLQGAAKNKPQANATGFLADEFRNITFDGERKAAISATGWWVKYVQTDTRIRALERSGLHEQAVTLCLGEEANQSNWAFNGFIKSLDEVLKINQDAFDEAAAGGFQALEHFEPVALLLGLLAAAACLSGVLPRIREYSV